MNTSALYASYLFMILVLLLVIVPFWRIFLKANKVCWHSLVPFYNIWEFYGIAGVSKWLSLISIPIYVYFYFYYVFQFVNPESTNSLVSIISHWQVILVILASTVATIIIYAIAINRLGYKFGKSRKFSIFVLGIPPILALVLYVLSTVLQILLSLSGTLYDSALSSTSIRLESFLSLVISLLLIVTLILILVSLYILAFGKSNYQDSNNPKADLLPQPISQPTSQYLAESVPQVDSNPAPQFSRPDVPDIHNDLYSQPFTVKAVEQSPIMPPRPLVQSVQQHTAAYDLNQYQAQPTGPVVSQPDTTVEPPSNV